MTGNGADRLPPLRAGRPSTHRHRCGRPARNKFRGQRQPSRSLANTQSAANVLAIDTANVLAGGAFINSNGQSITVA